MGFLHEITRKHNPCPLRRMPPRLRRLHSFCPLARLVSLFLLFPLFRRFFPRFIRASTLAFDDRSIAKLAGSFTELICAFLHLHICGKYNHQDSKIVYSQTNEIKMQRNINLPIIFVDITSIFMFIYCKTLSVLMRILRLSG